jgi:hypothetical protein
VDHDGGVIPRLFQIFLEMSNGGQLGWSSMARATRRDRTSPSLSCTTPPRRYQNVIPMKYGARGGDRSDHAIRITRNPTLKLMEVGRSSTSRTAEKNTVRVATATTHPVPISRGHSEAASDVEEWVVAAKASVDTTPMTITDP